MGTGARLRVAPVILEAALADTETFLDLSLQYNFGPDANQDLSLSRGTPVPK